MALAVVVGVVVQEYPLDRIDAVDDVHGSVRQFYRDDEFFERALMPNTEQVFSGPEQGR